MAAATANKGGEFVNEKMNVQIPWDDLVAAGNLKTLLVAIVQRLDRHEHAITGAAGGGTPDAGENLVVIDKKAYDAMLQRLEVVENTQLQSTLKDTLQQEKDLAQLAAERQSTMKLAKHVIPLATLKKRVEACEANFEVNTQAIDDLNNQLTETVKVLHETLQRELANMVTKDEFAVLEGKHDVLQHQVDEIARDIKERLEKMIQDCVDKVATLTSRVQAVERKVDAVHDAIQSLREQLSEAEARIASLEETVPLKADRAELEAAIKEIRDELEAMNLQEIIAMAEQANARIDAMDERVDGTEDDIRQLREFVEQKQQELEDKQLEKQIETLRQELEEAKAGVFAKANARMDDMQAETEALKDTIADAQGRIQVNRENIEEFGEVLRAAGANISTTKSGGGTKALVERLQADVARLQERYAEAARKEADGQQSAERTEALVSEIQSKMREIAAAKADKAAVDRALRVKADKEAVARDTEANQRAVDAALTTMNAGTQGIQQLLEKQESQVADLETKLHTIPDRSDIEALRDRVDQVASSNPSAVCTTDQAEAMYGAYGVTAPDAAIMSKPLGRFNCLTCHRPLAPQHTPPMPALPMLSPVKGGEGRLQHAYVPSGATSPPGGRTLPVGRSEAGDSIVDVTDLHPTRAAGGAHTATLRRSGSPLDRPRSSVLPPYGVADSPGRRSDVVGEDNRVYRGRDTRRSPSRQ